MRWDIATKAPGGTMIVSIPFWEVARCFAISAIRPPQREHV